MSTPETVGPLDGIRVIDLSTMISGPLATMLLADQGADVIKVEAPGPGDMMRFFGAMRGGMSSTFVNNNRSKRGMILNLRTDEGRDVLRCLIESADVLVQNFRPGTIDRMGFGYDDVKAINENIVYVSISGFGETGPLAKQRVYDNVIQGLVGMPTVQADPDTKRPELVRNLSLDKATAYTAAQAITAALFARERGRGGQHVKLNMLDVGLAFMWPDAMMNHTFLGDDVMTIPPFATIYSAYETADGFMTFTAVQDQEWQSLCRAAERPDYAEDERFSTLIGRMQHMAELRDAAQDMLKQFTTEEWCRRCAAEDVPHSPVLTLEEVAEHPQVRANRALRETEHPAGGHMREALPAAKFGATQHNGFGPAPTPGEHTDAVLRDLGLDDARIAALRSAGAVL